MSAIVDKTVYKLMIFYLFFFSRSKFKFKVEVYMMELYNDRLIDLFGKDHSGEVSIVRI